LAADMGIIRFHGLDRDDFLNSRMSYCLTAGTTRCF